jgi:hypothetical protein
MPTTDSDGSAAAVPPVTLPQQPTDEGVPAAASEHASDHKSEPGSDHRSGHISGHTDDHWQRRLDRARATRHLKHDDAQA